MKEKELLKEIEVLKATNKALVGLKSRYKPVTIKKKDNTKSESTLFLVASDWHIEEKVNPKTINGLNEFNLQIAEQRAESFWNNSLRLLSIFERDTEIKDIVVCLLGDFISGNIHEELLAECSLKPIEAIWKAQNMIAGGLDLLQQSGKRISVICKDGNHSRVTKKVHIAGEYGISLETFMYLNLAKQFPKIKWQIDESYHSYITVYDRVIRIHHGHFVRYNGGVGGVYIPMNKAIAQWNKSFNAQLNINGHFHNKLDGGNFISNGSLIGYNAFAVSIKAEMEPPQQTAFLFDKKHSKTIVCPVFLE